MNPFVTRITGNQWLVPVTVLGLVLGVLLQLTWVTWQTRSGRLNTMDADQRLRVNLGSISLQTEYVKLSEEVADLRAENTKLQNAMSSTTGQTKVLNESLQTSKEFAGLTEIEGPGIVVILRDAPGSSSDGFGQGNNTVHDLDVLKVVNELWASGAEAISVNGHRVVAKTSFRCVGPVIHIEGVPIASPVTIRAVGDAPTLRGGITLPNGVISEIRNTGDPSMVSIETVDKQTLPAYGGSSARRYGKVPTPKAEAKN